MSNQDREGFITISVREHQRLLDDSYFLECLECCGVDNWDGYDEAQKQFGEGNY